MGFLTVGGPTLKKISAIAICIWLALLFYISAVLVKVQQAGNSLGSNPENGQLTKEAVERIEKAAKDIEELRKQNEELKNLLYKNSAAMAQGLMGGGRLREGGSSLGGASGVGIFLGDKHEALRRKLENGMMEFWYFISGEIKRLKAMDLDPSSIKGRLDRFLADGAEQFRTIWVDSWNLKDAEGAGVARKVALDNLTNLMQRRLRALQNPADCDRARKLRCNLNKGCGFGCQLHHVTYCFIVAYGTKRTMILDSNSWRYSARGWNSVFQPISETCLESQVQPVQWRGEAENENDLVVSLPIVDGLRPRPPYLPLSFPKDLAGELLRLHGNPPAWFIGQFVYYLMRYSKQMKKELEEKEVKFKFQTPIVGLHVRRTDKVGAEAQFHGIEEYMEWAEGWFKTLELKLGHPVKQKRVYIATDDPNLLAETKLKYKDYEVIGDKEVASSAGVGTRYSEFSLHGVIADIHFLSKCDYLVCTFSSQVCRIAYEIMQVLRGDAAHRVHSLDDIYYFGGQHGHEQVATLKHKARHEGELNLDPGDVVGIAGNHWDGFSKGKNTKNGQMGLYPSYKAKEKWRIVKFPSYPEVK